MSGAWLNCGFRREPGKRRTSITVSALASCRHMTSSSAERVPWPMVKTRTRIESPLSGKEAQVAATVSWDGLRELASFRAEKGCAISVYVDLDPSVAPTAGDAASRVNSLIHTGEEQAEAAQELPHGQREAMRADLVRIREFFKGEFDRDGARGIAVFCSGLDNAWRTLPLGDPVADKIAVGREFHLAPLVPLVGRGEGALVAVVGRERGTVYILRSGRLEELVDQFDETPGRHDQGGWSQARYQRHIETLVHEHLKEVAEQLDRRVRRLQSPRIVVVTTGETRADFEEVLSHEVENAIVGWTHAEAHAAPTELLQAARPILEKWEAKHEQEAVERWREESGRGGRATAGWPDTLEAASDARVDLLLFQEGAERTAWQCPRCGRVSTDGGPCPRDGTREAFAVFDADDGSFLGLGLAFGIDREGRQLELGYVVAPEARGRGVATRTLELLTQWGFSELDALRIELRISADNEASKRVAANVGYRYEGTLRSFHFKQGIRDDFEVWSRLPSD